MSNLVIVESPAKAHTIGRILGSGWKVMPSVGHVRDLPEHNLGIAISADGRHFTPEYEITEDKHRVVSDLVKAAGGADEIFLASDPDREGEAIAWHLREIISDALSKKGVEKPFHRVEYNEITPRAVRAAIANPHDVDMARVNAQQARRLLDRLVGWKVSPALRRAGVAGGRSAALSAGRVQSVALRMVCERESEIQAFKPEKYWLFSVRLRKLVDPRDPFDMQLRELDGKAVSVSDEPAASGVAAFLAEAPYEVSEVRHGRKKRNPAPPFTTSTLQQAASTALGFSPDATMRLAQSLYEGSLITYMRTDSQAVSRDAQDAAGAFIGATWGAEYARPHTYSNRAGAQAAHECIRPTDPALRPQDAASRLSSGRDSDRAARLYGLIWRRFVASQMAPAEYETLEVSVSARRPDGAASSEGAAGPRTARLSASTSRLAFPGFLKTEGAAAREDGYNANAARKPDAEDEGGAEVRSDMVRELPPLAVGEALERADPPVAECKETKPRPRYNEASLVKALEKNGIGRPSTFASVIATLKNRKYVTSERRVLSPTELGSRVNGWLVPHFPELLDIGFTAGMERRLDEVEDPEKKLDWQEMLADFNAKLVNWLKESRGPEAPAEAVRSLLSAFSRVSAWAEPEGDGSRAQGDLRFVQSVADDYMGTRHRPSRRAEKTAAEIRRPAPNAAGYAFDPTLGPARGFSMRQLESLGRILLRYRDQVPGADAVLQEAGLGGLADAPEAQPPDENTVRIVDILSECGVEPRSEEFFSSLRRQVKSGKRLSPKQLHWLGQMFLDARERIPGFSRELCESLGVAWREPEAPIDRERVETLLSGLARVERWNEPVKRGRRTFDDHEFVTSVSAQFGARNSLSPAQLAVLDRMFLRYRDQIPDADATIARYGIKPPERSSRRRFGSKSTASE